MIRSFAFTIAFLAAAGPAAAGAERELGSLGQFAKWVKVEVVLRGPEAQGEVNPFAIAVDCIFTSPAGKTYGVPGFYDGDGRGGQDGNVWKVRFSADEAGRWTFISRSADSRLEGFTGSFDVTAPPEDAPAFHHWGRLEHPGNASNRIRYLKFRDGPYWLKAGCDDPENFLGRFQHHDTPAEREAAVDYLSERGVNSLYVMTHTIDGDHNDVWPWLGRTPGEAKANGGKDARFDIPKLEEWRELFEHMQARGVVPYLILEDDSAWKDYDHERYYREMVARFGYLPALLFNIGEESNENYSLEGSLALAGLLARIDPFDHPRGIHNVNEPSDAYVDAPDVDFTAIQTGDPSRRAGRDLALRHNPMAVEWIRRSESRGKRALMVGFDEGRPELDRVAWWSAYLGGAVWEAHVLPPYDRPLSAWEPVWTQLGGTRAFLESLPFWEMEPANALVKAGDAFCLARPGVAYALYLPSGGTVAVDLAPGADYEFAWWNPANGKGGNPQDAGRASGGEQRFAAPGPGDWALRIVRPPRDRNEGAVSSEDDARGYFPPPESRGGWRKLVEPEAIRRLAGMDPEKLARIKQWLLDSDDRDFSAVVIRRGYIVLEVERGNSAKTDSRRVASVSKAICATVLAIASERSQRGLTPKKMKFDDPAFRFIPWAEPLSDPRKERITVQQLLNHTSGICPEATGAPNDGSWDYILGHSGDERTAKLAFDPGAGCGYSTHALAHASLVCETVTGKPYDRFAIEALFQPIGVEHWWFQHLDGGARYGRHPSHGMGMPARDLARIAYCMLRGGWWKEEQVIPRWFVDETAAPTHEVKTPEMRWKLNPEVFSHGWELPARHAGESGRSGAGIPADARSKPGSGGQLIAFVPSLDLVITRQTGSSGDWQYEEYLRRACAAVLSKYGVP
jgi:CubicO group peptidase (beta-lactamase class C family)